MSKSFEVKAVFNAEGNYAGKLGRMSDATDRFSGRMSKAARGADKFHAGWNRAAAPVKDFGRTVGRVGVVTAVATGSMLRSVVEEGAGFEKMLAGASTKFGKKLGATEQLAAANFAKMKAAAMDVGENTEMSAMQAAGALKFMAMAGEDPAVAMAVLKDSADFATAGELELARATDVMSDALGPLLGTFDNAKDKVEGYRKTMDLMTFATTSGNMGIEEMFEATKMGGAAFRSGGQDAEMFAASVAVLSNAGIKGSKAGKDLARIIDRLAAPSKKAAAMMAKIKFDPIDKDGSVKDFDVLMGELGPKLAALTEGNRVKFLSEVIGANSKSAALALMDNAALITDLAKQAGDATGLTAKQAKDLRNTTEGMLKGFDSAVSTLKLSVFEVIKDDVNAIADASTRWLKANREVISGKFKAGLLWLKDNFAEIVKWGERIGKVALVFWAVDKAVTAVRLTLTVAEGAVKLYELTTKGAAAASRLFGMNVADAGKQFMATRGDLGKLGSQVNNMQGPMGKFGAVAGLAGAAFIGWEIGKLINELTGADTALAKLLVGMDSFIALTDKMNERKGTATQDDFLARQKSDLADMEKAYKGRTGRQIMDFVGLEGSNFGADEERVRAIDAQKKLIQRLEAKKRMRDVGIDTDDTDAVAAFERLRKAKSDLESGKGLGIDGGKGAGWFDGPDSALGAVNRAQADVDRFAAPEYKAQKEFDWLRQGLGSKGQEMLAARQEAGAGAMAAVLPSNDLSLSQLETQNELMRQVIDELRKGNAADRAPKITVNTGGGDTSDSGAVSSIEVDRTGTYP